MGVNFQRLYITEIGIECDRNMKVVFWAGGVGIRILEESEFIPKLMIETGGRPILWYIMKEYSYYEFHEYIICVGYK